MQRISSEDLYTQLKLARQYYADTSVIDQLLLARVTWQAVQHRAFPQLDDEPITTYVVPVGTYANTLRGVIKVCLGQLKPPDEYKPAGQVYRCLLHSIQSINVDRIQIREQLGIALPAYRNRLRVGDALLAHRVGHYLSQSIDGIPAIAVYIPDVVTLAERMLLQHMSRGIYRRVDLACHLGCEETTIKTYRDRLSAKLAAATRTQLMVHAHLLGLIRWEKNDEQTDYTNSIL